MLHPVSSASLPDSPSGLTGFEAQVLASIDPGETASLVAKLDPPAQRFSAWRYARRCTGCGSESLAEAGIPVEILAPKEHQASLLAWLGDPAQAPCLTFHAHIDTVPAGDLQRWTVDPFGGEVRDGIVYGRGAGDDKGSVAAQSMALVALAQGRYPIARLPAACHRGR